MLLYLPPSLPLSADLGALVEQLSTAFVAVGLTMVTHTWTSQPAADVWAAITPAAVLAWDLGDADAEAMRRGGVRVVTTLTGGSDPIGHWARGRRENAIADAQVSRVAEAGFARLGYMYPADPGLEGPALLRRAALARACGDRGLREPEPLRIALEAESAAASLATLAAGVIGRLAVCAHDVDSALAALAGARLLGMRVPEDLAVIGVHDAPAAGLADPPLTVVAVDAAASARYMAAVVYALLEGRPVPAPDFDVAGLIERASVPGRA
ncbi:substrate-binding domain-containing protein [Nocardia thailandica]